MGSARQTALELSGSDAAAGKAAAKMQPAAGLVRDRSLPCQGQFAYSRPPSVVLTLDLNILV